MIVTLRIHRSSRCSVAGAPCTPTLATRPPGRIRAAQLEGLGDADRLDRHVGPEAVGEVLDQRHRLGAGLGRRDVGARGFGGQQPGLVAVNGDDVHRAEQPRAHDGREPHRAGAHDDDDVGRLHSAVQDADLVARRSDVGEHEHLLVCDTVGNS